MDNWGMVGHEWAVHMLARDLAAGRLRHAYLFTGPPAIGKRTLAWRFAQAINCEAPLRRAWQTSQTGTAVQGLEPCGQCRACVLIAKGGHPDVTFVYAGQLPASGSRAKTSEARTLKIEQIREIERQTALTPYEAKYRIPILLRFHEATLAAQNALLKTLEEPPARVVLLLTADSSALLLPTIVSRCQGLHLRPLPIARVQAELAEKRGVAPERAGLLANLSGGRLGWAVGMIDEDDELARRTEQIDELLTIISSSQRERLGLAEALAKRGRNEAGDRLELWQNWWRDVLLASGEARVQPSNIDRTADIQRLAEQVGPAQARSAIESIRRTADAIERNANLRLAIEVLVLDLPRARQ